MTDPSVIIRTSISGYLILPVGEPWPVAPRTNAGKGWLCSFNLMSKTVLACHLKVAQL
jgi:hypothetical protein